MPDSGPDEKLIAAEIDIESEIDVARTEKFFFKNLFGDRRPGTYGALIQA